MSLNELKIAEIILNKRNTIEERCTEYTGELFEVVTEKEKIMPLNDRKIITIILDECKTIQERCTGYKEELFEVITEIITAERQHRVKGTNIQQQINDKCYAAGDFLAESRNPTKKAKGGIQ